MSATMTSNGLNALAMPRSYWDTNDDRDFFSFADHIHLPPHMQFPFLASSPASQFPPGTTFSNDSSVHPSFFKAPFMSSSSSVNVTNPQLTTASLVDNNVSSSAHRRERSLSNEQVLRPISNGAARPRSASSLSQKIRNEHSAIETNTLSPRPRYDSITSNSSSLGSQSSSNATMRNPKLSDASSAPTLPAGARSHLDYPRSSLALTNSDATSNRLHNGTLASAKLKGFFSGKGRSHEKAKDSIQSQLSHSSSTSVASSSPPRTPPDETSFYGNAAAAGSNLTLPPEGSENLGQKKSRLGLFNKRMNGSTDNLSIASTMSSASMMLRKIGTLGGRLTKRSSMSGISSVFGKDREKGSADVGERESDWSKKLQKPAKQSVSSSVSPAAALARRQQQIYADQEAAKLQTPDTSEARQRLPSNAGSDKRLNMIEKEKEKLKNRKQKKWGVGSLTGNSSLSHSSTQEVAAAIQDVSSCVPTADGPQHLEVSSSRTSLDSPMARERPLSAVQADIPLFVTALRHAQQDQNTSAEAIEEDSSPVRPLPPHNAKPHRSILKLSQTCLAQEDDFTGPPRPAFTRDRSRSDDAGYRPPPILSYSGLSASPAESPIGLNTADKPFSSPFHSASNPDLTKHFAPVAVRSASSPAGNRRCVFAPALSIHVTWPAAVYDRRSEPATCNRLTPALAQRIKEELNSYKLNEMAVHRSSRIHTRMSLRKPSDEASFLIADFFA